MNEVSNLSFYSELFDQILLEVGCKTYSSGSELSPLTNPSYDRFAIIIGCSPENKYNSFGSVEADPIIDSIIQNGVLKYKVLFLN